MYFWAWLLEQASTPRTPAVPFPPPPGMPDGSCLLAWRVQPPNTALCLISLKLALCVVESTRAFFCSVWCACTVYIAGLQRHCAANKNKKAMQAVCASFARERAKACSRRSFEYSETRPPVAITEPWTRACPRAPPREGRGGEPTGGASPVLKTQARRHSSQLDYF